MSPILPQLVAEVHRLAVDVRPLEPAEGLVGCDGEHLHRVARVGVGLQVLVRLSQVARLLHYTSIASALNPGIVRVWKYKTTQCNCKTLHFLPKKSEARGLELLDIFNKLSVFTLVLSFTLLRLMSRRLSVMSVPVLPVPGVLVRTPRLGVTLLLLLPGVRDGVARGVGVEPCKYGVVF